MLRRLLECIGEPDQSRFAERSSREGDTGWRRIDHWGGWRHEAAGHCDARVAGFRGNAGAAVPREERSEEHTSELQSQSNLVCRLLLEKKQICADTKGELNNEHPTVINGLR